MKEKNSLDSQLPNQRILIKTLLSAVSEGSAIFLFLFGILIARTLGPTGYGEFTYALAYCALFALVIESGLGELLTRDLSHDSVQGERVLRAGLGFQILLAPIVIVLLIASTHVFQLETTSRFVIITMLVAVVSRALKSSLRGLLRGIGEFSVESISMAGERIALLVLGFVAFIGEWNIAYVVTIFAGFKLIDLMMLSMYIHYKVVRLAPTFMFSELKWLIHRLLPLSITMAIWALYNYTDRLMLGYFRSAYEVGQYGAIYQFFEGMVIIPSVLSAVFLPLMSYEYKKGKEGVQNAIINGARLLIAASIPIVCISLFAPDEILAIFFGHEYIKASTGLSILLGSAPFVFLFWFLRNGLIAIHQMKTLVYISGFGVIFNIISNLVVIPRYGLYGACMTTLATEILTFVLILYVLRRNGIHGPGFAPWIKSLAAGAVLIIPMLITKYIFNWALLGVPIGLALAHLLLCRIGFWKADEYIMLRRWHLSW